VCKVAYQPGLANPTGTVDLYQLLFAEGGQRDFGFVLIPQQIKEQLRQKLAGMPLTQWRARYCGNGLSNLDAVRADGYTPTADQQILRTCDGSSILPSHCSRIRHSNWNIRLKGRSG
jgi:hypothetical protein